MIRLQRVEVRASGSEIRLVEFPTGNLCFYAEVEPLLARLEELEAKSKWPAWPPPEGHERVLAHRKGCAVFEAEKSRELDEKGEPLEDWSWWAEGGLVDLGEPGMEPSHWRPMPDPPGGDDGE